MERQVSTITPADTGTMMLPGAAAGALGFTAANIGKQLLASKFKGYGHLATSSLASAGFGALVGGLGGSFINKKPRSTPMQASYNNGMNNNNYIDKQAGVVSSKTASQIYPELAMLALEKRAGWTSFKHGLNMMKDSVFKDKSWRAFKGSAKFTGTQIKNDIGDVVQKYKPKFLKNTSSVSETANTAASTAPNKSFIQRHPVGTAVGALGTGYLAGHMLTPQPQNNQPEKVAGVGNILAAYARKNPIETAFLGAGALGMGANAYAKRNGIPVEFSSETNPHSANFKSNLKQYFKHGLSGDALRLTGKFIKKEHPILGAISNNAGRALQGLATVDATKGLYNAYKAVKYKPREKKASTESEELKRVATALGGLDEESRMIRSWGYENAKPWLKANKWKIGLGAGALAGGIYGAHKLRQKYNENYAPENIGETHLIRNGLIGAGLTGAGNFLRYAAGSPGATKPGAVGKVYLAGAAANALGGALLGKTVYDGYKKFSNPIPRNRD